MTSKDEIFISVDVETAGPIPGEYSMLSIGACNVYDDSQTFSCTIKPITLKAIPKALEISGFSLAELAITGTDPVLAMTQFKEWVQSFIQNDERIVFVGFNAPFDWSFINYYFHYYLGDNPFGIAGLDIKSMYFGKFGSSWSETKSSNIAEVLNPTLKGDHDALHDAKYQAELFRKITAANVN